ncbi:hypothetical protein TNCV_3549811 [Trichonephila clavipes]|nr:hypothetical protein TNCV_3549811 [Trichonephila clavipes]
MLVTTAAMVLGCRVAVKVSLLLIKAALRRHWNTSKCVSLNVEFVTPTKVTGDVESLLFGRSQDNYSTIGPSPPLTMDF